jgi:hypothetical protein
MDILTNKKWIYQEIDTINDTSFIEKLKHLLEFFNKPETDSEYNQEIDNALKNIEEGKFYSTEEVRAISKKWRRK